MGVEGPAHTVLQGALARRYYLEGRTKLELAQEFGLSRFKVARLLDQALSSGLVRIEFHDPGELEVELSSRLQDAFRLQHCVVVGSDEREPGAVLRQVGEAAASLLTEIVTEHDVLGLSWSRAAMATGAAVRRLASCPVVQLTGSLGRGLADQTAVELVREVARVGNGVSYCFYAPMIVRDAATARTLRAQPEVARTLARYGAVTKAVVGVGAWEPQLSTVVDALSAREWRALRGQGVVAEVGGIQIGATGTVVVSPLTARTIGATAAQLRRIPEVIAVTYGEGKAAAVRAALLAGLVDSVVTHRSLALELLELADG